VILPVVIVVIEGSDPDIDRDIQVANEIWSTECEVFVDVLATLLVDRPNLLVLSQEDCSGVNHVVSDEEDELYSLGRGFGADVVGYYISGTVAGVLGCAAHPPDRRGFWAAGGSDFDFVWIHEAIHVVGNNPHVTDDTDNLIFPFADLVTNLPPDLNQDQCARILNDPALLSIPSIVLNL
jgi:hypothetical protein